MDCRVLFFLLILTTTQATSLDHHCNSDVYSSASGMDDLQQPTTLQYCLIDNCTIIRNDTGQQLDIVYTTQSRLVVTPTDGQTSMLISKNDTELFCSTPNTTHFSTITQAIGLIQVTLLVLVSSSIAVMRMMFKESHNTFGKLIIFYNIAKVIQTLVSSAATFLHFEIALHILTLRDCITLNTVLLSCLLLDYAIGCA